jgi:hypothetical protein
MNKYTCFALRDNAAYYVANNECYALAYPEYRSMLKKGHCGTMRCPFYKPHRSDIRLGDIIYDKKGEKIDGLPY